MASRYHTVPLLEETWRRLGEYRLGGASYDDVVRRLLEEVPLERWMAEHRSGKPPKESPSGPSRRESRPEFGDA